MNEKQKRFADEYLKDLNQTRAYMAVYKPKNRQVAGAAASRLLKDVKISEYIAKRMKKRQERTEITQDKVIKELAKIAFSNATDYARVVEKTAQVEVDGEMVPVIDSEGNPVTYRTVELELTENLSEDQKAALAVMKKGKDGYEVKPYDKVRALELLGKHMGMFKDKPDADIDMNLNVKIDYGDS